MQNQSQAEAQLAQFAGLKHLEAKTVTYRGGWRVMVRRLAGGDWFPTPATRA